MLEARDAVTSQTRRVAPRGRSPPRLAPWAVGPGNDEPKCQPPSTRGSRPFRERRVERLSRRVKHGGPVPSPLVAGDTARPVTLTGALCRSWEPEAMPRGDSHPVALRDGGPGPSGAREQGRRRPGVPGGEAPGAHAPGRQPRRLRVRRRLPLRLLRLARAEPGGRAPVTMPRLTKGKINMALFSTRLTGRFWAMSDVRTSPCPLTRDRGQGRREAEKRDSSRPPGGQTRAPRPCTGPFPHASGGNFKGAAGQALPSAGQGHSTLTPPTLPGPAQRLACRGPVSTVTVTSSQHASLCLCSSLT